MQRLPILLISERNRKISLYPLAAYHVYIPTNSVQRQRALQMFYNLSAIKQRFKTLEKLREGKIEVSS